MGRMVRFSGILAVLLIGTMWAKKEEQFNVDVFVGWGGCYRPMEWTAVEINIDTELTEPFEGILQLSAKQDSLNRMHVMHRFVVTPDVPTHLPLVSKFVFAAEKCEVQIRDSRSPNRITWQNTFDLWDPSFQRQMLTAINENELLIGLIGERKFGLLQLPRQSMCVSDRNRGKVYVQDKMPRAAPWDWTGYAALDALVLYDPDWTRFNAYQLQAICDFVHNGGMLLLIPGIHPLDANNPIAQMLPFELQPDRQIRIEPGLLMQLGLSADRAETTICRTIEPKGNAGLNQISRTTDGSGVCGVGYVGFGRVAVLGFDPDTLSDLQKTAPAVFWTNRLGSLLEDSRSRSFEPAPEKPEMMWGSGQFGINYEQSTQQIPLRRSIEYVQDPAQEEKQNTSMWRYYEIGYAQTGSNAVIEHLYNIAEMQPLSIWWVILLLTLLAILLGPVDYIVLKRKEMLPLTWVTSTGWIILFSIGAYYGVQALRGGSLQIRMVSTTDGIQGAGRCWRTEFCGIFAPRSSDYIFDDAKDLYDKKQWWSGVSPSETQIYSYRQQPGSRNLFCTQEDGANIPWSIPVNIWTTQTLMNEYPTGGLPLSASVERRDGEIVATVTNLSNAPIREAYVLFSDNRRLVLGPIDPLQTKEFSGRPTSFEGWDSVIGNQLQTYMRGQGVHYRLRHETPFAALGVLQRTQTILQYLQHGAAVVCAQYEEQTIPYRIKGASGEHHHIQLVRQVIFPEER
ncbi:MAG: hypothetical protein JW828_07415 [Sedimentisphaerales bacterium]|nr:hypothetical protein [Sedimentisphaerales bacterium]